MWNEYSCTALSPRKVLLRIPSKISDRMYHQSVALMQYVNSSRVSVPFFQVFGFDRKVRLSNHPSLDLVHHSGTPESLLSHHAS